VLFLEVPMAARRIPLGLLFDVRYGLRMLRKSPGFTAVAVVTLALGIGANTAIFSVVRAVLLPPLPFENPSRLVQIQLRDRKTGAPANWVAYRDVADWRAQNRSFESIGARSGALLNLTTASRPASRWASQPRWLARASCVRCCWFAAHGPGDAKRSLCRSAGGGRRGRLLPGAACGPHDPLAALREE
jgi:hypothetical protein